MSSGFPTVLIINYLFINAPSLFLLSLEFSVGSDNLKKMIFFFMEVIGLICVVPRNLRDNAL